MTLIGLLRHGEVEGGAGFWGHTDTPLTEQGWHQMQTATNSDFRWDRVITSPLERCAGFAEAFAREQSLPIQFEERIKEMHFGAWESRTAADIMAEDPDALERFWNTPDRHPPPAGESLPNFQARVLGAWDDIIRNGTGRKTLLVTHGGVIRVVLGHVKRLSVRELLEMEVQHGSLYILRIARDTPWRPSNRGF